MDVWMMLLFIIFCYYKEIDILVIYVVVGLYWDGLWKMLKCGRNIDGIFVCVVCVIFLFSFW